MFVLLGALLLLMVGAAKWSKPAGGGLALRAAPTPFAGTPHKAGEAS